MLILALTTLSSLISASPLFARNATLATSPVTAIQPGGKNGSTLVNITGVSFPSFGQDVYLGIPFGQPPIGDLRFTAPKPAVYNATFSATTQPPACIQNPNNTMYGTYGYSEDCLQLNIYKPSAVTSGDKVPVMVWIYGGSFTSGGISIYNASGLVGASVELGQPVVYVAVQYRLGILGWGNGAEIAMNNASNLGLRDIKLGLEWVQQNIQAFGGDPEQVTIFGQSAGAIAISLLYLDSTNKGLFRSAVWYFNDASQSSFRNTQIMESGAQSTTPIGPTADTWQGPYNALVNATGCNAPSNLTTNSAAANQSTFECLKALPVQQIANASVAIEAMIQYSGFIFGPSIDGDLIPASPHALLAQGNFSKIPFISGNNLDEGTLFVPTSINSSLAIIAFLDVLEPKAPNLTTTAEILTLYPDNPALGSPFNTGNQTFGLSPSFKQAAAIIGDNGFQSKRRWFLESANQHGLNQTWSYQFEETIPGAGYLGTYHASEIPYIYGSVSLAANYTTGDLSLSRAMIEYWLNFVYYTNPNGPNATSTITPTLQAANATYWSPYGSSADLNILRLQYGNISLFKDDYRQTQMDYLNSQPQQLNLRRRDVV
ncbi:hypothetical protein P7C73_g1244, partial [Tremellales sp. Uapishka_1]